MNDEFVFRISGIETTPDVSLAHAVWDKDASAWGPGDDDPADRLGWLELPDSMKGHLDRLDAFTRSVMQDDVRSVVLLGMGGSSLAPEVFFETFGSAPGHPDLWVLDATHPDQIRAVRDSIGLDSTLWVVSSKSGSTIETMSLYAYFRGLREDGSRFVAITDPRTSLQELGETAGFRDVFINPPDIGGRYSALSLFGLVPAALVGVDIEGLLDQADRAAATCGRDVAGGENPGLSIGVAMGEAARAGKNKLTFVISDEISSAGDWLEQLVAESTGKHDTGIVPVAGEPSIDPGGYGDDRIFVWIRMNGDETHADLMDGVAAAGHPVITTELSDPLELGAQMFVWEFATAVAGAVLGINAFDQPNVEAAKKVSRSILESGDEIVWESGDPGALLDGMVPDELAVLAAFAPRNDANSAVLQAARRKLVQATGVATMGGFGPRYLHSTGQLHKGGPPRLRAVVALDEPRSDEPIPGGEHGFARLVSAQASGDFQALQDAGRRAMRVRWSDLVDWSRS
jgi:transaldolase/glucose-6-phosphate isomerase